MTDLRALALIPTYDEIESLPVLVDRLLAAVPELDVLILDDASPDGTGALDFDFPFDDATMAPFQYPEAAITNTFFWSNHLHDVLARLGFDEAAGNFQTTNATGEGQGGDALLAEALALPAGKLELVGGKSSRDKVVAVAGLSETTVDRRLAAAVR